MAYEVARTTQPVAIQHARIVAFVPDPASMFAAIGLTYNAGASTTTNGAGIITRLIVFTESADSIAIMGDHAARVAQATGYFRSALSSWCKCRVVALTPVVA